MKNNKEGKSHHLYTSLLLFLIAIAAVTATTIAWLSIADNTRVRSMSMDVTSGTSLRFDIIAHGSFEDYKRTLNFGQISQHIYEEYGYRMESKALEPLTSTDYKVFSDQNGTAASVNSGEYIEFTLHFMSNKDMVVHLSSANSKYSTGQTFVKSSNAALPHAMRISFTADDKTSIYNPGMSSGSDTVINAKAFGLSPNNMIYSDDNALFSLKAGEDKPVLVHIWLEGTDTACTDAVKNSDYSISFLFEGTDANNNLFGPEDN